MHDGTSLLPSTHPEASPPSPTSASKRGIRVVTPSIGEPQDEEIDTVKLQRQIYLELAKLTKALNAQSPKSPSPQVYSPFQRRRGLSQEIAIPVSAITFEAAEYDALGQQFNTLVIISTFTANLIIAFLTVCNNIVSRKDIHPEIIIEVGMFFSLLGMAVHGGVIIIAGRCAALALKHAKRLTAQDQPKQDEEGRTSEDSSDDNKYLLGVPAHEPGPSKGKEKEQWQEPNQPTTPVNVKGRKNKIHEGKEEYPLTNFRQFLQVCEFLQLLGTALFFLSVAIFIFLIFPHAYFPIVLLASFVAGGCLLMWLVGFWRMSATHQLIDLVMQKTLARWKWKGRKSRNSVKGDRGDALV